MTVKELIEKLSKVEDKDLEVTSVDYEYKENVVNLVCEMKDEDGEYIFLCESLPSFDVIKVIK